MKKNSENHKSLKPALKMMGWLSVAMAALALACFYGMTSHLVPLFVVVFLAFCGNVIYVAYLLAHRLGRGCATLLTAALVAFVITPTASASEGGLLICPAWFLFFAGKEYWDIGSSQQMQIALCAGGIFITAALVILLFQEVGRYRKRLSRGR